MKPVFPKSIFKKRREELLQSIGESILILPSSSEQTRNRDCNFPFRQDSDFWYLSHFNEPNAVIVLDGKNKTSILYSKPYDELHVIWEGEIIGQERAQSEYLFDEAYSIDKLETNLLQYLYSFDTIITPFSRYPEFDTLLLSLIKQTKDTRRARTPQNWLHTDQFIHPMRSIKDDYEIEMMQYTADISVQAHIAAMAETQPGMNEAEISALLQYHYAKVGGTAAYGDIVAGGNNACTLHYTVNNCSFVDGDLVLIDSGCEIEGYAADITRTYPVNGRYTEAQKKMYEWVLKSVFAAFDACKPGNTIRSPHFAAEHVLIEGMLDLGLLEGSVESVLADNSHHKYFMHGTSHWLGIDVHDVGEYKDDDGNWYALKPGMVITVEPGMYVRKDDESAPEELRGIGIRIEDDILITDTGYRNFTEGAPKSISDVEKACMNDK
ncbi:MAG: aminopeptidase P N-terminal domain-containing protein [Gammaproteobacteria bacterium]|nr:aminopeptidase P N-terminal domain-containing protein [Gammaproteobacteria bacterium]